jgi:sterol 14-demethylase
MEQKKFIKAGLTTANLRAYVPMISDETTHFLNNELPEARRVRNSGGGWGSFHVLEALSGLTILTAARTLQGKEVRAGLDKTFSEYYKDLDGGFTPLNFVFPNLPLPNYWRRDRAHKKMSDFYVNIIENRKRSAESSDVSNLSAKVVY